MTEGWGFGRLGHKVNQKKKKSTHRHRQQYGDYQRERGWGEIEESKGSANGGERRLDLG